MTEKNPALQLLADGRRYWKTLWIILSYNLMTFVLKGF